MLSPGIHILFRNEICRYYGHDKVDVYSIIRLVAEIILFPLWEARTLSD